jgi:hypothetical protein
LQPPELNSPAFVEAIIPASANAALNILIHFIFAFLLLKEIVPSTTLIARRPFNYLRQTVAESLDLRRELLLTSLARRCYSESGHLDRRYSR